jgi:secreted trypsin-like serine protease
MIFRLTMSLIAFVGLITSSIASPRIIGGRDALPHEYPYVIKLKIVRSNRAISICTATFISSNTLVTAAHCLRPTDLLVITPTGTEVKDIFIPEVFLNSSMDADRVNADVALIVLESRQSSNTMIPFSSKPKTGPAEIIGFGGKILMTVAQHNQQGDSSAGVKRVGNVELDRVSPMGRIDSKREVFKARIGYLFSEAMASVNVHGALSSRGDSGGPLIQNGKVIGVISGVDKTDQDETTIYSTRNYFTGLHTRHFDEISSKAIAAGSTLKE